MSRDGGEGSRVSIRGLSSDLTLTELNGNFIASTGGDPSRSFDYLLLPSSFIGSVEVYKSSEARLDEGGVGGVIINHTRRSEEHTSELQSLMRISYAVFCLKKKKTTKTSNKTITHNI